MADQSDVEAALTRLVSAAIYPQGTNVSSILGADCRIYRGWPNAAALNADLAGKRVNITVFPEPRQQLNTTRWSAEFMPAALVTPTLTVSVDGTAATFGGTADPGQVAGLLADNMAVVHRTETGDTPAMVAAILASYLRTQRAAVLSDAVVTVPGARLLIGRVVADQSFTEELRRQLQRFRITCWCPDPASRDAIAAAVDTALAAQTFIPLPDGTQGRLRFVSSAVFDQSQDAQLYRRDLVYSVDYSTTQTTTLPSMIFGDATFAPRGSGIVQTLLS
jgi:hypothetical protein